MKTRLPLTLVAVAVGAALALGAAPAAGAMTLPAAPAETPSPSPTSAGTTWALRPAAEDGPDGRVSLRHTLDAGAAASDLLALTNFSAQPATFAVYGSDGTVTGDGSFDLIPSDQQAQDGGSWLTIPPVEGAAARAGGGIELEVPSATTVLIPVGIAVPGNAAPGDHPAGIVAELIPGANSSVQFATRVGVRVHLRVTGDIVASLVPDGITATYQPSWNPFAPGSVTVAYAVANAGNVRLGSAVDVRLSGPLGIGSADATSEQREILPSDSVTESVTVPVWPTFLAWGSVAVTPTAVGQDAADFALEAAEASFTVWTIPWAQLLLLAALVGGFFLVRGSRRRSRARMQARIDAAVAAATAGTVADATDDGADAAADAETPVADADADAETPVADADTDADADADVEAVDAAASRPAG